MHRAWSWHQSGFTDLVLFRRTTPHERALQDWENSPSRWTLENRSRLVRSGGQDRRLVLEAAISCQHVPFDLCDFEGCRERYLKEFAAHLYEDSSFGMGFASAEVVLNVLPDEVSSCTGLRCHQGPETALKKFLFQ